MFTVLLRFGNAAALDSDKKGSGTGQKKAAAAGAAAGGSAAPKTLEEQIKIIERGIKYGTASDADKQKLEKLKKQLEAQHEKQRLALDKVWCTFVWVYACVLPFSMSGCCGCGTH